MMEILLVASSKTYKTQTTQNYKWHKLDSGERKDHAKKQDISTNLNQKTNPR